MPKMKSIRTARRRARFLQVLSECALVACAAAAAGAARGSFYNWRYEDPQFADDWDRALAEGIALLEDEAIRRARDGVTIPVFYGGKEVGAIRRPSDALLMFLLRAHRPERYRERPWVAGGGPYRTVSGGFGVPLSDGRRPWEMSEAELDREIEALLAGAGLAIVPAEDGGEAGDAPGGRAGSGSPGAGLPALPPPDEAGEVAE